MSETEIQVQQYIRKLTRRIYFWAGAAFLGAVSLAVGIIIAVSQGGSFMSGYLAGSGGGMLGASAGLIIATCIKMRKAEEINRQRVEENDERNKLIAYKSAASAFWTVMFALYAVSVFIGFISEAAFAAVLCTIVLMLAAMVAFYIIYRKTN